MLRWREAMAAALYGPDGFFVRPGNRPDRHFRTSAQVGAGFVTAIGRLLASVDRALGHPDPLDVVDVGAGRGELLEALAGSVPSSLARRLRPVAVEVAPAVASGAHRPAGRGSAAGGDGGGRDGGDGGGRDCGDGGIAGRLAWRRTPPSGVTGLLLATEWLDNIPVDVAEMDRARVARYVLVDPATGRQELGPPVDGADASWLARWWPLPVAGNRAEIGRPRDEAWASAVGSLRQGLALAVDYGHLAPDRPGFGTLTGFRAGREVPPVPDGSCDLTAHVALDAVRAAGAALAGRDDAVVCTQAEALRALGVTGRRPPLSRAYRDPTGYLRDLADASLAGELTDPGGLGGHRWLLQPVALPHPASWFMAPLPP